MDGHQLVEGISDLMESTLLRSSPIQLYTLVIIDVEAVIDQGIRSSSMIVSQQNMLYMVKDFGQGISDMLIGSPWSPVLRYPSRPVEGLINDRREQP